jgi:hypothetical protein
MSRQQLTHQDDRAADDKGSEAKGSFAQPATAIVRQMLASGNADPRRIAQILATNPRASHEIFTLLNQTMGHSFANQVLTFASSNEERPAGGLGKPRDVASFDMSSDIREDRATIDGPPKMAAPDTGSDFLMDSRATIDGPPKTAAPDTGSDFLMDSRATIDGPPKTATPDTGSDIREDRATIDHPHTEKKQAPWVGRARRFNRAHADNVRAFLDSTGNTCVDPETGEPDPQKVARWQADHGVSPDGRIGDETVRAAVTDPSLAL